jgi:hypothetical protein
MKENHLKHYIDNLKAIAISSIKLTIKGAIPNFFLVSKPWNCYMQGIGK